MKQKKRDIIIAILGVVILGIVVAYFYNADQARLRGFNFGNDLKEIQDELKEIQTDFAAKYYIMSEGAMSSEEFLEFSDGYVNTVEELILRYDQLTPPEPFESSVELFKLSTISQLESDKKVLEWIQTGDENSKIRSDLLLQESFEYELAALEKFNAAKAGINP